jgi:hypothetical protein
MSKLSAKLKGKVLAGRLIECPPRREAALELAEPLMLALTLRGPSEVAAESPPEA